MKYLLLLTLFFSCKGQGNNDEKLLNYEQRYMYFYDKTMEAVETKNLREFRSNYDSTKVNLDKLIENNPSDISLLSQKLGLLKLNNNFKEMIEVYDKLILSDYLDVVQKQDYKFGRFYCMVLDNADLYNHQISEYYQDVKKNEIKISELLSNPDVYTDQPEIYKRMKLSYYFEGREETLKEFKPISDKIPYKLKYDLIKEQIKTPEEFLKDGMDFPVQYFNK